MEDNPEAGSVSEILTPKSMIVNCTFFDFKCLNDQCSPVLWLLVICYASYSSKSVTSSIVKKLANLKGRFGCRWPMQLVHPIDTYKWTIAETITDGCAHLHPCEEDYFRQFICINKESK